MKKSVFCPTLEKEILRMIHLKKEMRRNMEQRICKVIILRSAIEDESCVVIISLSFHLSVESIVRFTPPSDSITIQPKPHNIINGYTFLENELIGCSIVNESCANNLVDKKELILAKDSIPGYPNAFRSGTEDAIDHAPMRVYKVISSDSILLIKSAFIP